MIVTGCVYFVVMWFEVPVPVWMDSSAIMPSLSCAVILPLLAMCLVNCTGIHKPASAFTE